MGFISDSVQGRAAQQVLKRRQADIEHGEYVEPEAELQEMLVEKGWDDSEDADFEKAIDSAGEISEPVYWIIEKAQFTEEKRMELAKQGKALSDGSYPIDSETDLDNAIILAKSGHGNVAAAKSLIRKRAKALGCADKLPEGWSS